MVKTMIFRKNNLEKNRKFGGSGQVSATEDAFQDSSDEEVLQSSLPWDGWLL